MGLSSLLHAGALLLIGGTVSLRAQSLAERVSAAADGAVTFHFAARPGLCGDGEHFMRLGRSRFGSIPTRMRDDEPCGVGPVQVRLTLRGGDVIRVETWAGTLRTRDGRSLGAIPAAEAARFLLNLAQRGDGTASAKAILPAVLADSATVWPGLLVVARDSATRSRSIRQEAAFWLSRFAAGQLAGKRDDPFGHEGEHDASHGKEDLKTHAVFVLSQLPHREGVPALLEIARSHTDPEVRSNALFWLGQSGDPRALALFEALLLSRGQSR